MDSFITFVANNYVWFMVISIFLIFALIGYIYDIKREKNDNFSKVNTSADISQENIIIPENKSINDMLSANKMEELKEEKETSEIINNN